MKDIIKKCSLFDGVKSEQLDSLMNCLSAVKKYYRKDSFIFKAEEPAKYVGIVLQGGVNVIQEDFWGNRSILSHLEPGELFGETFSCAGIEVLPVSVVAAKPSAIMFIDYKKIVTVCPNSCEFHAKMISNMLRILANRNIMMMHKMESLSRKTTRDKLLAFLSSVALRAGKNEVTIPYNRQELADYLSVDRSALSRELSHMRDEGLLNYKKNVFMLM